MKGFKGEQCAQVFYGLTSHVINVYPMKSKKDFLKVYKAIVRDHGAPSILRRDNAKEQQSADVLDFNRDLFVQNQYSEPGYQHQNPFESQAIRYLKQATCITLDRSEAPEEAWFFAAQHVAKIHNMTSDMTQRDFVTPTKPALDEFQTYPICFRSNFGSPSTTLIAKNPSRIPKRKKLLGRYYDQHWGRFNLLDCPRK